MLLFIAVRPVRTGVLLASEQFKKTVTNAALIQGKPLLQRLILRSEVRDWRGSIRRRAACGAIAALTSRLL